MNLVWFIRNKNLDLLFNNQLKLSDFVVFLSCVHAIWNNAKLYKKDYHKYYSP